MTSVEIEEELLRCMRCGECQAVCPTFYVTGREGDKCFSLFQPDKPYILEGNEAKPNFLNAYLLSIACQYDYLNELYTKDSGEYERRFKKLFKWWGLDSERFVFISSAGEVDEENSLFLPDTEVVLMPGENNNIPFVIVLFRGSELLSFDLVSSFRDWIVADMDARPTYLDPDTMGEADGDSELMVHTGFWKAFSSVKYRLKAELSEKFPDHRIWVTGNSLGGALANLCGMWLHLNGFKNNMEAVYSFAAPRCGNWKLNEMYYNKMQSTPTTTDEHRDAARHYREYMQKVRSIYQKHFRTTIFEIWGLV